MDADTREFVLAGAGELNLEVVLKEAERLAGVPLTSSDPSVSYREGVGAPGAVVMTKSANRLNRLHVRAVPLARGVVADIEGGVIGPGGDPIARARRLVDVHGWDAPSASKARLWAFGPEAADGAVGSNVLVDCTHGQQDLGSIRDSIVTAFLRFTRGGALASEPLRGVRFEVHDAVVHGDSAHRGQGQIMPAAGRAFAAAMLCASPVLIEPIFALSVSTPGAHAGAVFSALAPRRAAILCDDVKPSGAHAIAARAPAAACFGLVAQLREASSGNAFTALAFDGWAPVPGDAALAPDAGGAEAARAVAGVRARKGLPPAVPPAEAYMDRL